MNNLEEDIKNIKELIQGSKDYGEYEENKYFKSIENILQDYTRQKQINEEHHKENGELREKVKELEAKLEFKQWGDLDDLRFEEYMNEFIPKQKIKDFKRQIKLGPVIVGGRRNAKILEYGIKLGKIKVCEELLKESEDK